jgi:hypothetical protein
VAIAPWKPFSVTWTKCLRVKAELKKSTPFPPSPAQKPPEKSFTMAGFQGNGSTIPSTNHKC